MFGIQRALIPLQPEAGPQGVQSIALPGGQAALAQDKAAHLAHDLAGFRIFIVVDEIEHGAGLP